MMSLLRVLVPVSFLFALSGCTTYTTVVPANNLEVSYEQGAPIVTSSHNSSTVLIAPSRSFYEKGDRISFHVGVRNDSSVPVEIGMDDVLAKTADDQILGVHTYESRIKEIKRAQMWAAIGAGMQAASEGYAAGQAGYSTSTTTGSVNSYGTYGSSYGTYSGTTTTYDTAKAAAAQAQANANSRQRMNDIISVTNSATAEAELLLRRTTLEPGETHTATILIDAPKDMPSNFVIAVDVADEVHVFEFGYEQYSLN
jgi:hypothetical protein